MKTVYVNRYIIYHKLFDASETEYSNEKIACIFRLRAGAVMREPESDATKTYTLHIQIVDT